jgi:MoaA/NifB/PqqE/SkfB family radical SAM enzyme/SAM-dependent methyltransferase
MRALVKVGYRCNHKCTFCHAEERRDVEAPRAEVAGRIARAAHLGHSMVVFSGGEATLRPELIEWARSTAAFGMDVGLITNGTLLERALVESLLQARLRYVQLSLHGGTADVHDEIVGAPTFHRVLRSLQLLSGRGLDLWVNCVVTRRNVAELRGVVDAVRALPDVALKFSFVEPRGGAAARFEELVPRVAAAAAAVSEALDAALARTPSARVAHDFFPSCLLPGYESRRGDLRAQGFWTMAEVGEPDLYPVDAGSLEKPPVCRLCALRGRCPGLFAAYHARYGAGELRPLRGGPQSNSFHWIYEGRVIPPADGSCPVRALGIHPWDPARHLFVRNGERVARFRTETLDFCDEDIADVKLRAGQVYLDASGRDAPDDFARQLVKLRRSDECGPCQERDRCTGLFEPAAENLFQRDDARVLEILASLEGDVLDIGCGEGPYGEALAASAREGRIRYTGVEPDANHAARMRERWPWADVRVAAAEEFEPGAATYDHVLVLRSWNHLRDPAAVVTRLAAALRAGGTLTVVDNEAFGLARTRADAARAERSAARFEHYRTDRGADAHAVVKSSGLLGRLVLLERRDVGTDTSNQWLLRYAARPEVDVPALDPPRPHGIGVSSPMPNRSTYARGRPRQ